MYVMGLSYNFHDSAVALIRDGTLVAAVQEERFNRDKNYNGFPQLGVDYCLKAAGIGIKNVEHCAFYWNPSIGLIRRAEVFLRGLPASLAYFGRHKHKRGTLATWLEMTRGPKVLRDVCGYRNEFHFVEHHLAHAASTFNVSPFREAAILSVDLAGEKATTLFGRGVGNRIEKLSETYVPHSMGIFYGAITQYLGFVFNSDEYKVMGLAGYGDSRPYYQKMKRLVKLLPEGQCELDLSYFAWHLGRDTFYSDDFTSLCGPPRSSGSPIEQRHIDIAAACQRVLEEAVQHMADHLYEKTQLTNLCLAGGVALNSVMNGKLIGRGPFKKLFIQPAANDAGCAVGAAYYLYNQILGNERKFVMEHAYLGPEYSDEDILKAIVLRGLDYRKVENIEAETARLIAQGNVIGWFQGRMEFGPRALGARSILADPRRAEMKEQINRKIKHREDFRPFAPAILGDRQREYFASSHPSPFMNVVLPILEEKRGEIPAVTHVDGTGRLQTVTEEDNGSFWRLIKAFGDITGVPVVLNTSFNVAGEPIVMSPDDALDCFVNTDIDFVSAGNYIVKKRHDVS